jgi:phage gpG-like protein
MKFEVNADFRQASRSLKKKNKDLKSSVKKALLITALKGINIIEDRTSKGRSFKGTFFKKYSASYAAYRLKKGRSTKPDLQFTGQMMGSMSAISTSRYAEIYFTRAAESKKAAMNNKSRPFFGFSRNEQKTLSKTFERYLK